MRRRTRAALAAAVVLIGCGLVGVPLAVDQQRHADWEMRAVPVERTSLAAATALDGVLTRGEPETVEVRTGGVLTHVPEPGAAVGPGEPLYARNGRPAFFLQGDVPLWRTVKLGDWGPDVRALNEALADARLLDPDAVGDVFEVETNAAVITMYEQAGYEIPTATPEGVSRIERAERRYDDALADLAAAEAALAAAEAGAGAGIDTSGVVPDPYALDVAVRDASARVEAAEERLTAARSERVSPSDVLLLDTPAVLVDDVPAQVGDALPGEVLSWTGEHVSAEAELDRRQAEAIEVGDAVTLTAAGGKETGGLVAEVRATGGAGDTEGTGDTAGTGGTEGTGREPAPGSHLLRVEVPDQAAVRAHVDEPVRIEVTTGKGQEVLAVPVTALVALTGGGFAVEKVTPGAAPGDGPLVPVGIGVVSDTEVQVSSPDLRAGDEVWTP